MDFLTSCETRKCSAINFITVNIHFGWIQRKRWLLQEAGTLTREQLEFVLYVKTPTCAGLAGPKKQNDNYSEYYINTTCTTWQVHKQHTDSCECRNPMPTPCRCAYSDSAAGDRPYRRSEKRGIYA